MIFLYTLVVFFLGAAMFLINRRVASLEKKFIRTADAADKLLKEPALKEGNGSRRDLAQVAKSQVQLGLLVQRRDRLEEKHDLWVNRATRFNKTLTGIRSWRGRKLPYTFGVLDVYGALYAIDYAGFGHYVSPVRVVELVTKLVSNG